VYSVDMVCDVFGVPKAFIAIFARKPVLPLFVMAEKMVTGDVLAHGKLQGVRLRFLLQVSSGFADRSAEYVLFQQSPAWELLRGYLGGDGIGNGRHALG
jgi:hypothetical protein